MAENSIEAQRRMGRWRFRSVVPLDDSFDFDSPVASFRCSLLLCRLFLHILSVGVLLLKCLRLSMQYDVSSNYVVHRR